MAHWVQASLTTWKGKRCPNLTQMGKDQSITVSIKQLVKVDLNQTHHCQSLSFDNSGPFGLASVNQILSWMSMVKSNFPTCSWENVGRKMVKQCDADSEIYTKRRIKTMSVIWRVPYWGILIYGNLHLSSMATSVARPLLSVATTCWRSPGEDPSQPEGGALR